MLSLSHITPFPSVRIGHAIRASDQCLLYQRVPESVKALFEGGGEWVGAWISQEIRTNTTYSLEDVGKISYPYAEVIGHATATL